MSNDQPKLSKTSKAISEIAGNEKNVSFEFSDTKAGIALIIARASLDYLTKPHGSRFL